MNRTINRLKLIFVAIFAVSCVGVLVYHVGWEWPRQKCEAKGDWWDWQGRTCAHPILISDITGRTMEEVQAEKAAAAKAAAAKAAAVPAEPAPKAATPAQP
ncbi:MAG: hypothetical protein ACK4YQ_01480 [Phenylobacterium sp.]|uniref:hypothetical protein n=1 Tax=Phenylobacterium sp. TaxID=1871053 RepID=UPI00391C3332